MAGRGGVHRWLVDIDLFSSQTPTSLRSLFYFETDLILRLPRKQHPPCIILHPSATKREHSSVYEARAPERLRSVGIKALTKRGQRRAGFVTKNMASNWRLQKKADADWNFSCIRSRKNRRTRRSKRSRLMGVILILTRAKISIRH